jgi:hypothetical protein
MYTNSVATSTKCAIYFRASIAQTDLYCNTRERVLYNQIRDEERLIYCQDKLRFEYSPQILNPFTTHIPILNPFTTQTPTPPHYTNKYYFINDVESTLTTKEPETPIKYDVSADLRCVKAPAIHTNFPLYQSASNTIKIPSKVEYTLRRLVSKKALKQIHPNLEIAIELCLLFISQLSSTYFTWNDGSNPDGWKSLKAAYLRQLLNYQPDTYKKIRELLETPLMDGPIIECDYIDQKGIKCFHYRLSSQFIGKGIKTYELKSKLVQELWLDYHHKRLKESQNNPICMNLMDLYPKITLPTTEEITLNAKKLIDSSYKSKKGKQLTFLNKKSKEFYSDASDRTFVEDGIEAFNYLTSGGLILPRISHEFAGGRIVDSFVLMPSYIRNMCKLDDDPIIEVDYSCLHPNIAMTLYGGKQAFITHQLIADKLNVPISIVKTEHLKFFNKHPEEMQKSPLYNYYIETEPFMMKNLIREKRATSRRYKITSQKMFEKEVAIMTDVIRQLALEGIVVGYVYDALFCTPNNAHRVKEVMDEQVVKHGVMTTAKISSPQL